MKDKQAWLLKREAAISLVTTRLIPPPLPSPLLSTPFHRAIPHSSLEYNHPTRAQGFSQLTMSDELTYCGTIVIGIYILGNSFRGL